MLTTAMRSSPVEAIRIDLFALSTLSLGAAAIHFAVIGEHFAEYFLFGVFFGLHRPRAHGSSHVIGGVRPYALGSGCSTGRDSRHDLAPARRQVEFPGAISWI